MHDLSNVLCHKKKKKKKEENRIYLLNQIWKHRNICVEIVLGRGFSVAVDGEITYKGLFSLRLHGLNVKKREERERDIRWNTGASFSGSGFLKILNSPRSWGPEVFHPQPDRPLPSSLREFREPRIKGFSRSLWKPLRIFVRIGVGKRGIGVRRFLVFFKICFLNPVTFLTYSSFSITCTRSPPFLHSLPSETADTRSYRSLT